MSVSFYPAYYDDTTQRWQPIPDVNALNLAVGNAADFAAVLGMGLDGGLVAPTPIAVLEPRCTRYLRSRVGRPDPETRPTVTKHPGHAEFIDCGRRAGYLQICVAEFLALLREGRVRGATHVYGC